MYIDRVPNRNSAPCILLRESYWDEGKVKKRTLANITNWDPEIVAGLSVLLKNKSDALNPGEDFTIERSLPHGHVAAVLGVAGNLDLLNILSSKPCREQLLVLSMIVARILSPSSKLATARGLDEDTFSMSLGDELDLGKVESPELYSAMDWLYERQSRIEKKLAKRHLSDGTLVLYDVTSTYFEGKNCSLAKRGYNRDQKKGKLQIVFGLLCNKEGCPIAVEVFEGNTGDPSTLSCQIEKLSKRFGLKRVVLVGDRGMLTSARIDQELREVEGLDWISCLKFSQIEPLLKEGQIQMSLWEETGIAEITSPRYPGERLIICRNPIMAKKRAQIRNELLNATEKELEKIISATQREKNKLKGKDKIGIRVGKIINRFKAGRYFKVSIEEDGLKYTKNEEKIQQEQQLDGVYIVRTSVKKEVLSAEEAILSYKRLSTVEKAFRSLKTVDLKVRPIFHRLEKRVKSHIFLCMLAYYLEWHMRQALAPILFDDHDKQQARSLRKSVVKSAQISDAAKRKALTKKTEDGLPVHSFRTLLEDLATVAKVKIKPNIKGSPCFNKITNTTPLQDKAFELLGVNI